MQFDARTAKLLKPGAHLTIDGCPGLRMEATALRRTWTYRYRSPVDGKMRQVKLGAWPAMSLAAAAGEWERVRTERDAGVDPSLARREQRLARRDEQQLASARVRSAAYTVKRLVGDYVKGHVDRQRKAKGAAEVRRMFDTMLDPIAELEAASLTRAQAFNLLEALQDIPVQAAKLRAELGAAWDYALDAGRLPENTPNWWRQIMRGRLRSKGKRIEGKPLGTKKRVLTAAETAELLPWLPNFSRQVADVLTLYLWTITRGSEIVSMAAEEISEEPDGLWWTVPKAKTKNARHEAATDLRVPLVGRAAEVVRRRMKVAPKGWLFPSAGQLGHVEQGTVQTAVHYHQPYSRTRPEHLRPRLTVTRWAPHDLRRTGRTMLAALGCPNKVGEALLGHMKPGIVGVYNLHQYDEVRREWLTRLSDHLEGLVKA